MRRDSCKNDGLIFSDECIAPLFGSDDSGIVIDLSQCMSGEAIGWNYFAVYQEENLVNFSDRDVDASEGITSDTLSILQLSNGDESDDLDLFSCNMEDEINLSRIPSSSDTSDEDAADNFGWGNFPLIQTEPLKELTLNMWKHATDVPEIVAADEESELLSESEFSTITDEDLKKDAFPSTDTLVEEEGETICRGRRHVRFSTIHVREYAVTLGDHPWANAYPLSLDWSYAADKDRTYEVDEYYKKQLRAKYRYDYDHDEIDEFSSHSQTFGRPKRLDVMERRSRLANILGISQEKLDAMERQRKHDLHLAATMNKLTRIPPFDELDDTVESEDSAVTIANTSSNNHSLPISMKHSKSLLNLSELCSSD